MANDVTGPTARIDDAIPHPHRPGSDGLVPSQKGQRESSGSRPRVLVVDDEANIRLPLSIILRHAGFEVSLATSGEQALSEIAAGGVDLVLLDVGLPGISGCEVCRLVRKDPTTRSLPVVMLSAHTSDVDVARGLAAGADHYEPKPFSRDRLIGLIDALTASGAVRQATHA